MPRSPPNKVKLNDLTIKNLKPKSLPYLTWDTKQRGLALRVEPSGHMSFKCIYSRHGRPRWYHIGHVDIGIVEARKAAGKIMVLVDEGKDPQADRKAEKSSGTFAELAIQYRDQYAKKNNKSWKQADDLVTKHLLLRWGKLRPADISRSDVKTMMTRIKAPIVANQVLASASAIFAWGIREELVKGINPCAKVDRNATTKRERILSDREIPQFWAEFGNVGLIEGAALRVLLLTGQRPGEVAHMRSEHIVDGWWTLPGDPIAKLDWPGTKNGKTHLVWLPKAAQSIIAEMNSTGMVFAGSQRGGAINGLDVAMRDICKKLKVEERVKPHDLRRTHGSAIAVDFGRDAMHRIENHIEGGLGDVYDRNTYAEENKKIMEAVANKFMALIEGTADNALHPSFGKAAQ